MPRLDIDPRARNAAIAITIGVVVASVGLWWFARHRQTMRENPPWTRDDVPPDPAVFGPAATPGCPAMYAPCEGHTMGRRLLRTYPATLDDDQTSLIGGHFKFNGHLGTVN